MRKETYYKFYCGECDKELIVEEMLKYPAYHKDCCFREMIVSKQITRRSLMGDYAKSPTDFAAINTVQEVLKYTVEELQELLDEKTYPALPQGAINALEDIIKELEKEKI